MNILFLALNVNIKARTGDAVHVRELALNLAKLGHHVSLVAWTSSEQSAELQSLKNHPNIQISYNKNLFKIPFPRSRDVSRFLRCLKIARKNPPDVIYERSFSPKTGVVLSRILRKPLVVEINGIAEDEAKLQGTYINHKYTKDMRKKFRQLFFKSANKIVAVTSGIKEDLYKRYNIPLDKIVVIPNGANTELFRPMDQATVKEELGLSLKSRYICFVGNLAPWQGVEYLVQSAPLVLERVPDARFLIVGEGMMQNELEDMVKTLELQDKFVFTGSVPFEHVPKYINASDVCVVPKRIIKSGYSALKLYEYMACGKPVIATNTQGFEILEKYNVGILTNPENTYEFANTILQLITDKKLMIIMAENGRHIVTEKYSWKNTARKVAEVGQILIDEKNSMGNMGVYE